jgi:phosphate uptake regulator
MPDKHLSSRFDADISQVLSKVFEMGGFVESQVVNAMQALNHLDLELVDRVIVDERRLNAMEAEVDEECINIIARRQPAARDLRLLMSISKTVTNLERAGDEARKVAKRTRRIAEDITPEPSISRKSRCPARWPLPSCAVRSMPSRALIPLQQLKSSAMTTLSMTSFVHSCAGW